MANNTKTKRKTPVGQLLGQRLIESMQEAVDAAASGQWDRLKSSVPKMLLRPADYSPKDVRDVRRLLGLEVGVFAAFLGVTPTAVLAWERRGGKSPPATVCRLMDEVRRDPDYWRDRLAV